MTARLVAALLCALALWAEAGALARALRDGSGLVALIGPRLRWITAACVAGACLGSFALARELRAVRDPGARATRATREWILSAACAAALLWLVLPAVAHPYQRAWLELGAGVAAAAWCAWAVLALDGRARRGAPRRAFEMAVLCLCATALGTEAGLRVAAWANPTALFARTGEGPRATLARFRPQPGAPHCGGAFNRRGHFDVDFEPHSGQPWIAAVGDSFHVGVVPLAQHFTSVAEGLLGLPIDNVGVPGIGPPEYLELVVDEVLPRAPHTVVVSLFLGNDFEEPSTDLELPWPLARAVFSRDRLLLWTVPARLERLRRERAHRARAAEASTARPAPPELAAIDDEVSVAAEVPTLSEESFVSLERARARTICRGTPPGFDAATRALEAMRTACGSTPFRVVLIPDEFQVEDELWRSCCEGQPGLQRDLLRDRMRAWLDERGIPVLDLLPVLRDLEPLPDGRRHAYLARDTHFNARGNRVAGQALARFLEELGDVDSAR